MSWQNSTPFRLSLQIDLDGADCLAFNLDYLPSRSLFTRYNEPCAKRYVSPGMQMMPDFALVKNSLFALDRNKYPPSRSVLALCRVLKLLFSFLFQQFSPFQVFRTSSNHGRWAGGKQKCAAILFLRSSDRMVFSAVRQQRCCLASCQEDTIDCSPRLDGSRDVSWTCYRSMFYALLIL